MTGETNNNYVFPAPQAANWNYAVVNGESIATYPGRISAAEYDNLPAAPGTVSVEQFGAVGIPGTDDHDAIQAAIDYAIANEIQIVTFGKPFYSCKAGTFTPGGFGGINPTGAMINVNSALAPGLCYLTLKSTCGGTVVSRIGYLSGGNPALDAQAQQVSGQPHRGGGVNLYGTQANDPINYPDPALWKLQYFEMDGITIEGATGAGWGGAGPTSTDTSDKGIFCYNAVRRIVLKNGGVNGFFHELLYGAGTGYGELASINPIGIFMQSFVADGSNHSVLNWQDADLFALNCSFGNAYIVAEQYGNDSVFVGCSFYYGNQLNFSAANRGYMMVGGNYAVPVQGPNGLRTTRLNSIKIDRVQAIYIGSYTYGEIDVIDGLPQTTTYSSNIDLKINWTMDAANFSPLLIVGPGTIPVAPLAEYQCQSINIDLTTKLSNAAIAAGRNMGALYFGGYLDPKTVQVNWKQIAVNSTQPLVAAYGSVYAMPMLTFNGQIASLYNYMKQKPSKEVGGAANPYAFDLWQWGLTLYPDVVGHVVTLNALASGPYAGIANGQRFYIVCKSNGINTISLSDSATLQLQSSPVILKNGAWIELEWNDALAKATQVGGFIY